MRWHFLTRLIDSAGSADSFGEIGANLAAVQAAGITTPRAAVVTIEAWDEFRSRDLVARLIADAESAFANSRAAIGKTLGAVRATLATLEMPSELVPELRDVIRDLGGSCDVHSSPGLSGYERRCDDAMYVSERDCRTPEELWRAITRCWALLYSERTTYAQGHRLGHSMAVVVQAAAAPCTEGRWASGGHDVAGALVDSQDGPGDLEARVHRLGRDLQELFEGPVVVQWRQTDDGLEVVQVRRLPTDDLVGGLSTNWARQEDLQEMFQLELGCCDHFFARALQKKIWSRTACRELEIGIWESFYIVYDKDGLQRRLDEFAAAIATEFLLVEWRRDVEPVLVRIDDLGSALLDHAHLNELGDGFSCARVSEMIFPAQSWGGATMLSDGRVLVEAYPSGVEHKGGDVLASVYTLDHDGTVIERAPATFSCRATLRSGDSCWHQMAVEPYLFDVSDDELATIAAGVAGLSERFGEVRLEWTMKDGALFFQDLSLETHGLSLGASVLSPGEATGPIVVVQDVKKYDDLVYTDSIHVLSYNAEMDDAHTWEVFEEIRHTAEQTGPLIVVAPYPSTGLIPLVRYAAGFIFDRGNLLCHLAIVLREAGVPGVVAPGALDASTGALHCTIGADGVQFASDRTSVSP